jgi:superfamily II DNA or RNA helicase
MSPEEAISGARVRVIGSPERTGSIISDEPREQNGIWSVRILFDDGIRRMLRLDHLELLPAHRDITGDILAGQLEGPESLRRNLLHEKLHGRLSEVMYSMDTSDTTFYAYQFKPVVKLLESPTNSLLVADEVGLGKTIEAGLIWTELRAREGARTLLVICPPHLITKWKNELKRRFGVDAQNAGPGEVFEALDEARRGASNGFALVCSYHSLRPPKDWQDGGGGHAGRLAQRLSAWADEEEPFLDLLVMDEAAIMRNSESQTSKLGGLLAPVSRHKVYLSATPLHTHSKNLFTLLRRLDPDTFPDEHSFNSILEANAPLVRLRKMILAGQATREELLEQIDLAGSYPLLRESNTLADLRHRIDECESYEDPKLRADLAYRSERANLLSYVVTRTRKRDIDLNPVLREVNTVLVPLKPHEERLYHAVTDAVWGYAADRGISSGFLTVMPQRQVASSMAAACERLVSGSSDADELNPDVSLSRTKGNLGPLVSYVRDTLAGRFNPAEFRRADSKYEHLVEALTTYWEAHPNTKVVLFAFFKPTLRYLEDRLKRDGISSLMLTGDQSGDKQEIVDEFAKPDSAPILLSSEVGSEGLDLQFAGAVVNYDLPWNPMVVEQRIGRIHRIGQTAERIVVINLICQGTVDERIYDRLYDRLHLFQRTLGDLEAVIGPLINELTKEILTNKLSDAQQVQRIEETAVAMEAKMQMEEQLERDASILAAYGDYVINQIAAAHDRKDWITGLDLEVYIRMFFHRSFPATRIRGIDQAKRVFEIALDPAGIHEIDRFLADRNLRGQTRLTGMEPRLVRFDHRMFTPSERGIEVIHQAHPLVRFAGHHLRVNRIVQPVPVAVEVPADCRPKDVEPGLYAFVSQRWTVEGLRNYEKIHHEVRSLPDGGAVEEPQIAASIVEVAAALGKSCDQLPSPGDELLEMLGKFVDDLEYEADGLFHQFEERCKLENEDRSRIQLRGVDRFEERSLESLSQIRLGHEAMGRAPLVAATEGRIRSLQNKCTIMRDKIRAKSNTRGDCATIAAGFIQIH